MAGMAADDDDVLADPSALEELNNPDMKTLLDTINKLRFIHIGEDISLPQIIVVGDQSSGKSSVLEAISQVPFPIGGDVCTRFATELTLRNAIVSRVDVSIRFANRSGPFTTTRDPEPFKRHGQGLGDLLQFIEDAKEHMGIRCGPTTDFSNNVLCIEVSGPDIPALSLVDLPGFFRTATSGQSLVGKETVDRLVEGYLKQKGSIILAVLSANRPLSRQKILEELNRHDPRRLRTLGVITKPDLPRPSLLDEAQFLQLAKNEDPMHKFSLGWHVLRNRAEDEDEANTDERDKTEKDFFSSGVWAAIPPKSKGVASLRRKLGHVLLTRIQERVPSLLVDIETKLEQTETELKRFGRGRTTALDMRAHLADIAGEFQRLSRDAIHGHYTDPFFGNLGDGDRKLRARLRDHNETFHYILLTRGMSRQIHPARNQGNVGGGSENNIFSAAFQQLSSVAPQLPAHLANSIWDYRNIPHPPQINDSTINKELQSLAATNQGREFPGSHSTDLAIQLFKGQAKPWRKIAETHIDLVTDLVRSFVDQVFQHLIGNDEETLKSIIRECVDPFFESTRSVLRDKLDELLRPYAEGYGIPLMAEFSLFLAAKERVNTAPAVTNETPAADASHSVIFPPVKIAAAKDNFGIGKILDKIEVYYETSRRTFTENVMNLAVESCLVSQIPNIFMPSKVNRMQDDQVIKMASEREDVQSERELCEAQAYLLRQALEICRRYKPRGIRTISKVIDVEPRPARDVPSNGDYEPGQKQQQQQLFQAKPSAEPPRGPIAAALASVSSITPFSSASSGGQTAKTTTVSLSNSVGKAGVVPSNGIDKPAKEQQNPFQGAGTVSASAPSNQPTDSLASCLSGVSSGSQTTKTTLNFNESIGKTASVPPTSIFFGGPSQPQPPPQPESKPESKPESNHTWWNKTYGKG